MKLRAQVGLSWLLAGACAAAAAPAPDEASSSAALGLVLALESVAELPERPAGAAPVPLRLVLDRARGGPAGGLDEIDRALALASARGYRVILAVDDSGDAHDPESMVDWLEFLRETVRRLGPRVETYELGPGLGGPEWQSGALDPVRHALWLKRSILAARAEADVLGVELRVAPGAVHEGGLEVLRGLWSHDLAPYVDALPLWLGPNQDARRQVGELTAASLEHPPSSPVLAYVSAGETEWSAAERAVAAAAAGATVTLAETPAGGVPGNWVLALHGLLSRGYLPAPQAGVRLEFPEGVTDARLLGRFFDERSFVALVVFVAATPGRAAERGRVVVALSSVLEARAEDLLGGDSRLLRFEPAGRGEVAVRLETADVPRVVSLTAAPTSAGLDLDAERLAIESHRGLTAEEIIARQQRVQQLQGDRLERFTARGRLDLHFQFANGGTTIDYSIESNYFWERGGQLEWEETDYFFNGSRVPWKRAPQLPLIQPEKVATLPLDLTLDRTYAYRRAADDRVGGRTAYVVEFEPTGPPAPGQSLYRGRVWIDPSTFVRLQQSVVQTGLTAPVLSNEETDRFAPVPDRDAHDYWLFARVDGQQVWNTAGRSFVVRRELTFEDYEINPSAEEFAARRDAAYTSERQMMRDTEEGYRYLSRTSDGARVVEPPDTNQWFAAAGAFQDNSQDHVVPLVGANYFDYDLGGRGIQLNALFAGPFGFLTASKPDLWGRNMDATLDAGLSALKGEDRFYVADDEIVPLRIEEREQRVTLRFGSAVGQFVKVNALGGVQYRQYFQDDTAEAALAARNAEPGASEQLELVLPQDHFELSLGLESAFYRRGFTLTGSIRLARRSEWEAWGLRDTATGTFGDLVGGVFVPGASEPIEDRYMRWGVTAAHEWLLPRFQKIRVSADYLDGSDFDRFSRYQFGFFGTDRLNGYSGTGVRFDDGGIVRAGYSFNLLEVVRFDLGVDHGQVRQAGFERQSFTGLGVGGSFAAPWKTVVSLNYGRAWDSDIEELEGEQEFLLLVLKLF